LLFVGCRPDFGARASLVTEPRILAVKATPAEARPGDQVQYQALVALSDGTLRPDWSTCANPRPATENNVVGADCLGTGIHGFGEPNMETSGTVPADACTLFGPDTPAPKPGEPPFRPRDPDITGGYYLPIRVDLKGTESAIALERIGCNLLGATPEVAQEFRSRYQPNRGPDLVEVTARANGAEVSLAALPAGTQIIFSASWKGPETDVPSAESFVVYDVATETVKDRRESLRVSWYATAGEFSADSTGRGEDELESFTENTWTSPVGAGPAKFWVVLRDSRGGVDFRALDAQVVAK
jgi:hypothetical protein